MIKIFIIFMFFLNFNLKAENFTEASFSFGSNNFSRSEISYLTNISTRIISGLDLAIYKKEKQDNVFSLRTPINAFLIKELFLNFKPFYYPKNSKNEMAYGQRISLSYLLSNMEEETSNTLSLSFANQKQELNGLDLYTYSFEGQWEKNFYDNFFFLISGSLLNHNQNLPLNYENYSDISDLISINTFAFLDDTLYSRIGLQFARSFKPDYDSYAYFGIDRISAHFSDYNSYLFGLRLNFLYKNFINFSYNYLDNKNGKDKNFYKVNLGVAF